KGHEITRRETRKQSCFIGRPDVSIRLISSVTVGAFVRTLESMIQRFDQLAGDLPEPDGPTPAAAAAVQELMGGKFGEMSTLMNYTFQSFNFRGRDNERTLSE